ncbi:SLBB domain-containing protein [Candidatus Gottesmanbacteria bacterium]|nr:SLBB domain-containing protein [Candidatus Gottesmanbacteria bacterium]
MIDRFKIPVALTIIAVSFIAFGIYHTINKNNRNSVKFIEDETIASKSATIVVHVAGAVLNPGVYDLAPQTRVGEAIEKAGGFANNADKVKVDKILNLAQILNDGAKIYIPSLGEEITQLTQEIIINPDINSISINNASKTDLMNLTGIGEVRADKIINNRPYGSLSELVEKKIISQSVYNEIKDKISL